MSVPGGRAEVDFGQPDISWDFAVALFVVDDLAAIFEPQFLGAFFLCHTVALSPALDDLGGQGRLLLSVPILARSGTVEHFSVNSFPTPFIQAFDVVFSVNQEQGDRYHIVSSVIREVFE